MKKKFAKSLIFIFDESDDFGRYATRYRIIELSLALIPLEHLHFNISNM